MDTPSEQSITLRDNPLVAERGGLLLTMEHAPYGPVIVNVSADATNGVVRISGGDGPMTWHLNFTPDETDALATMLVRCADNLRSHLTAGPAS